MAQVRATALTRDVVRLVGSASNAQLSNAPFSSLRARTCASGEHPTIRSAVTGEVELPEFIQIMTMTREAEQEAHFWGDSPRHARGDEAVPLQYLTAAYRRKRVLDNVMDAELRLTYAQPKQSGDAKYGLT